MILALGLSDAQESLPYLWELSQQDTDHTIIYIGLGEYDKAMDHLEQAVDYNLFIPLTFLASSRAFDPLRGMPRFEALLERTNLAPFARKPQAANQPDSAKS